jgi:CDP-diacylglycerol---serine O-phosphatidyltransferase
VLVFFVVCGIARLARYNVAAAKATGEDRPDTLKGAPIPTSVLVILVLALAFATGNVHEEVWGGSLRIGPGTLHPLVLIYAVSGSAMVSATIRVPRP